MKRIFIQASSGYISNNIFKMFRDNCLVKIYLCSSRRGQNLKDNLFPIDEVAEYKGTKKFN